MIGDVSYEEDRREDKRDEHRHPVLADLPCPDETETDDQRNGRQGIEQRVERRQKKQVGPGNVGGRMIINEPAKKKAGNGTDSDNGDDYADWGPSGIFCDRCHLCQSIKHRSA